MDITVGLLGVHSENYFAREYGVYEDCLSKLRALGEKVGFKVTSAPLVTCVGEAKAAREAFEAQGIDYLMILTAGFSMGDVILSLEDTPWPLGVWAVPEPTQTGDIRLHSLVSANMYMSIIRKCFKTKPFVKWFYGPGDDPEFIQRLTVTLRALAGKKALSRARIGRIGDTAPTFFNLEEEATAYEKRFGLQMVSLPALRVQQEADALQPGEVEEARQLLVASAGSCVEDEWAKEQTARIFAALKRIVVGEKLDALAVSCWPDFQDMFGVVPCAAFTLIGEKLGVPVACEGDMGGAISLLALKAVSGSLPVVMDVAAMDPQRDQLLLWHCGIGSEDLAPAPCARRLIHHPMMNRKLPPQTHVGLSYDYAFRTQAVTVMRLCHSGEQLLVFTGAVAAREDGYLGTRGYVEDLSFEGKSIGVMDVAEVLFTQGDEHHLVLGSGDWQNALVEMAQMCGVAVQRIAPLSQ